MPRPEKLRRIRCSPASYYFKPKGIPISELEEIPLAKDELEAIRLADLNELFQEEAAAKMNISRATFGRIIMRAHNKIADAIINGKAIRISEDMPLSIKEKSFQTCKGCRRKFRQNLQNNKCPKCLSNTKE
jgi:predicted DNA-binding protein (UPF0251 family)